MTHHTSRITDVVPANFLTGIQTMETIAEALLLDEMALSSSKEKFSGLHSRRRCLKDELASVERLISDVVEEPSRLSSSIADHKSLLTYSPVCALPAEVLREIFLHYIALFQPAERYVHGEIVASHQIHTPVLLVCRRWRTTALADSRLWTTIPLIASGEEYTPCAHPLISGSPQERVAYWKALESRIEWTSALPLHLLSHFTDESGLSDPIARCRHFFACCPGRTPFPSECSLRLKVY
ncbi:hypothetical protein CPB85DRAFT_689447 [Mucidula mucida]|nr:hypothetical protein CPB85DRAFT_689447 [Mucidula mucida]